MDHGALAYSAMQYNHSVLRLNTVQKSQIIKKKLIHFVLKF
jgi:hypothetical protein